MDKPLVAWEVDEERVAKFDGDRNKVAKVAQQARFVKNSEKKIETKLHRYWPGR